MDSNGKTTFWGTGKFNTNRAETGQRENPYECHNFYISPPPAKWSGEREKHEKQW